MIIAQKYFILIFLLASPVFLFAQTPTVVPLDHNPALRDRKPTLLKNGTQPDTVSLPFFDDFSYYSRSSQPDYHLWMDQYVYINNSYPIQPRSNGVATFDALDANGNVYLNTAASFPADTLTSCPIDMGENGTNKVYLSFFYQPGGYGDNPDPSDSLILQFKKPGEEWNTIWSVQLKLNTKDSVLVERTKNREKILKIPEDTGNTGKIIQFMQVLLSVEGEYLYRGFQFRFVNFVSLDQDKFNLGRRGNCDHWHIDYVRLDNNRSENDIAYFDVAVIAPLKTLIKGYQSIPWNQMPYAYATKLEPNIEITYRNNNNIGQVVERNFTITDVYNNTHIPIYGGNYEIGINEIQTFRKEISNPFETGSIDSAAFDIKGYLVTDMLDRKENDTVCLRQFFSNYYARDDGVPESGYGFFGERTQNCAVACRYERFDPLNPDKDSLQAIRLYFNPTYNNETVKARYKFKIAVWSDDKGRPGEPLYISTIEYSPEIIGRFVHYDLGRSVYVPQYYWIGWIQVTSGFLNVGFDRNYNDKGNLWYNDGSWRQDFNDGTLMIRPVMGKRKNLTTLAEIPKTVTDIRLKLYPNPASQYLRIQLETLEPANFSDYMVEMYDVNGRLLERSPFTGNDKDVSDFDAGLYFVRLVHRKSGYAQTQKLVIE